MHSIVGKVIKEKVHSHTFSQNQTEDAAKEKINAGRKLIHFPLRKLCPKQRTRLDVTEDSVCLRGKPVGVGGGLWPPLPRVRSQKASNVARGIHWVRSFLARSFVASFEEFIWKSLLLFLKSFPRFYESLQSWAKFLVATLVGRVGRQSHAFAHIC